MKHRVNSSMWILRGRLDATVSIIPNDDNHPPRTFKTGISFSPAPADQALQTSSSGPSNPNYATVEGKVDALKDRRANPRNPCVHWRQGYAVGTGRTLHHL